MIIGYLDPWGSLSCRNLIKIQGYQGLHWSCLSFEVARIGFKVNVGGRLKKPFRSHTKKTLKKARVS